MNGRLQVDSMMNFPLHATQMLIWWYQHLHASYTPISYMVDVTRKHMSSARISSLQPYRIWQV